MRDRSIQGFAATCICEGLIYALMRLGPYPSGMELGLCLYGGFLAFVAWLGLKASMEREEVAFTGEDIVAAFLSSLFGLAVPLLLALFIGFPGDPRRLIG